MITTTTCVGVALADLRAAPAWPEHAGEHEVEEHEVHLLALEHLERLLAGAGGEGGVPLAPDERGEDVLQHLLVVDDQDVHGASAGAPASCVPGQLDDEAGAVARRAARLEVAAVAPDDIVADGEPEAGAAAGELGREEGLEDLLQRARAGCRGRCRRPRTARQRVGVATSMPTVSRPPGLGHGVERRWRSGW